MGFALVTEINLALNVNQVLRTEENRFRAKRARTTRSATSTDVLLWQTMVGQMPKQLVTVTFHASLTAQVAALDHACHRRLTILLNVAKPIPITTQHSFTRAMFFKTRGMTDAIAVTAGFRSERLQPPSLAATAAINKIKNNQESMNDKSLGTYLTSCI
jgi:hypothetical protein